MAKVATHARRARKAADLAFLYAEDGAFHSAARCLREALGHMEMGAGQRDADIDALLDEAGAVARGERGPRVKPEDDGREGGEGEALQ
jgi:hypothetical protein